MKQSTLVNFKQGLINYFFFFVFVLIVILIAFINIVFVTLLSKIAKTMLINKVFDLWFLYYFFFLLVFFVSSCSCS